MSGLARRQSTRLRQAFKDWETTVGQRYVKHTPGRVNYLMPRGRAKSTNDNQINDRPFPGNADFRSQPVLSDDLKEEVWKAVVQRGRSLRETSVDYQIDIRRVAAVVRLKQVEKQWVSDGKQLATVYNRAVMEMLPQTLLTRPVTEHEPINDLMVHPSTMPQVFWPVAESQHFTRVEAGEAFGDKLLPAEARIPHPQLYDVAKGIAEGKFAEVAKEEAWDKIQKSDAKAKERLLSRTKDREARTTTVQSSRWAFKFEDVVIDAKSTGRYAKGIGARYGIPHEDRKKGQVKIPTQVVG